ncbi:hypothetical protein Hdeb2414_s0010g00346201 [Helianthus debilis subsp. tardiflorus]
MIISSHVFPNKFHLSIVNPSFVSFNTAILTQIKGRFFLNPSLLHLALLDQSYSHQMVQ